MSLNFTKLVDSLSGIDAAKRRANLGGLNAASAAWGAAERASSVLNSVDTASRSAGLVGVRDAGTSPLASRFLGTGLNNVQRFGIVEAGASLLGRELTVSANLYQAGLPSGTTGFAKPPSWVEPASRLSRGIEGFAKPVGLDGLAGFNRRRSFGLSTSLGVSDSTNWNFNAACGLSSIGQPGALFNFEPGYSADTSFSAMGRMVGAGGLANGASGVFGKLFEPFEGVAEIIRKASGLAESVRPYLNAWTQIAEEAMRWAEQISDQPANPKDDLLAFVAYDALEEMQAGRHWVAVDFLEQALNLRATPERLEALWILLKRGFERPVESPPLWLTLDFRKAKAYLATAVYRGAERIRRRRLMEDDIWCKARGQDGKKELVRPRSGWLVYADELPTDELGDSGLDPEKFVVLWMGDRNQILDELLMTGTSTDKEIVELIRHGSYARADIRKMVGSPRLQAFERKIRRHRNNRKI